MNEWEWENFVKYFEIMRFVNMISVSYCHIGAGFCALSVTRIWERLCADLQSEGDGPQVAVGRGVVDDALAVEFALYADVSVVMHACKTNRHHRGRVVHLEDGERRRDMSHATR